MSGALRIHSSLLGAAICMLAGPAPAGTGDLTYMKTPPSKVGPVMRCFPIGKFAKVADPNAAGLVSPDAVVATGEKGGVVLSVAVDARKAGGEPHEVLRIDPTGKGKFHSAAVIGTEKGRTTSEGHGGLSTRIVPPATIEIIRNGRKLPAAIQGDLLLRSSGGLELAVTIVCGAEGMCAFGKTVRKVRVLDGDGNFSFSDRVPDEPYDERGTHRLNDYFEVAGAKGELTGPRRNVGEIVQVNGRWYAMKIDGLTVSAEPVRGPTGTLRIGRPRWEAELKGKTHRLRLQGGPDPVTVPADTYTVLGYTVHASGDPGDKGFRVVGYRSRPLAVHPGRTTRLPTALAMVCKMSARARGRNVVLSLAPADRCGPQGALVTHAAGGWPKRPSIEVLDGSGKVVHVARMKYG